MIGPCVTGPPRPHRRRPARQPAGPGGHPRAARGRGHPGPVRPRRPPPAAQRRLRGDPPRRPDAGDGRLRDGPPDQEPGPQRRRAHHLPHRHQPGDRAPAAGLRGGGGRLPGQALRPRGAAVEGGGVHGPPPAGPHHRGPEPAAGRAAGGARPGPGRPRPPRGRAPALQRRARPVRVDGRPRPAGAPPRGERPARAAGPTATAPPSTPTAASWSTGPGPGRRRWWPASTTCWPKPGAAWTPCGWSGSTSTRSSVGPSTTCGPCWRRRRPRSGPTPSPRWWATSGCWAGSSPSCSTTPSVGQRTGRRSTPRSTSA